MQLVQSSVGMEFVNAIMEPVCGRIRRRLKPLPREEKLYRPTVQQDLEYIYDEDVLSESEAEKQERIVQKEKASSTKNKSEFDRPKTKDVRSYSKSETLDENAPLTAHPPQTPRAELKEEEEDDDVDIEEENPNENEEEKASEEPEQKETPGNDDNDDGKDDEKEEKKQKDNDNDMDDPIFNKPQPFIFLAQKAEATLTEQWNDVLKNVILNLERLDAAEPKINIKTENEYGNKVLNKINGYFSYKHMLENISVPLLDAIGDLKSAANITIEDVETSARCLKYLREAHKTTLTVFRNSKDPLVIIWAAALLIITSLV